ncbi:FAD-dependent oxidoreductase [Ramlibacter sp. AW1]|uniref:FAD-dependent oxidoreductase n=1 Tax=Ramlibacter aurantiacus TaxID=2801330 RepID=A0A937D5K2_9BURK|nr:FAD-dependent oxidoreductase [Ramlibacter aurantiacus]MBL0421402.1 FAD-dependent oxidoreductase [Ramlibacter aurantiacus]
MRSSTWRAAFQRTQLALSPSTAAFAPPGPGNRPSRSTDRKMPLSALGRPGASAAPVNGSRSVPVRERTALSVADTAAPRIAPIARAFLQPFGRILWVAPSGQAAREGAPAGTLFCDPRSGTSHLIRELQRTRPTAVVLGDLAVGADVLGAWRAACPGAELVLLRRGTSTDRIDAQACTRLGIALLRLPGLNASHVAGFIATKLADPDGNVPADIRILGGGHVGQALARQLAAGSQPPRITMFTRPGITGASLGLPGSVRVVHELDRTLQGARAIAVCLSLREDSRALVSATHMADLARGARIVCVSKPDVFSDAALTALAGRACVSLVLDYGPHVLDAFRARLNALGSPPPIWGARLTLTSEAATSAACAAELDTGVVHSLAREALDQHVSRLLTDPAFSLRIPPGPPGAQAPVAHVIGSGINGLYTALVLRLQGYAVQVTGQSDGASHRANIRHVSLTETSAQPLRNPRLQEINQALVTSTNAAGYALLRRFVQDNPRFGGLFDEGLIRTTPATDTDATAALSAQTAIHQRAWIRGFAPGRVEAIPAGTLGSAVKAIGPAVRCPGLSVPVLDLLRELKSALAQAGVGFVEGRVGRAELEARSARGEPVIIATGADQPGIVPVTGWFFRLPAQDGEGQAGAGVKVHHPLPIGVMNVRRDGTDLLVSAGQVPPHLGAARAQAVKALVLAAARQHFPASFFHAERQGLLQVTECVRPGSEDGLSRIEQAAHQQILTGGTFAAGFTQALVLPLFVRELLQARADQSPVPAQHPGELMGQ